MKSGLELKQEVIDRGLCTMCGMCLDRCPHIKSLEDRLAVVFACGVENGGCYASCPRTYTDWDGIEKSLPGRIQAGDDPLGAYSRILMARSSNLEYGEKGQDGGTVSALMTAAMDEKMIDAAVLTSAKDIEPWPQLVTKSEDVVKMAGSKYIAAPSLRIVHQARLKGIGKLGVVGRPCQVMGIRKYQHSLPEEIGDKVSLVIGLFCMWSLSYGFNKYVNDKLGGKSILKVSIPKGELKVTTDDGVYTEPVDSIKEFIRPACNLCWDATSELADISVGAAEFAEGWNTLIVRSDAGALLVNKCIENGLLETREYPAERLRDLQTAVTGKRARAVTEMEKLQANGVNIVDLTSRRFNTNIGEVR